MPRPVSITDREGKRWRIRWTAPPPEDKARGLCDWASRTVTIDPAQDERRLLETIIDEVLHVGLGPVVDNDAADYASDLLADVLLRCGYRLEGRP